MRNCRLISVLPCKASRLLMRFCSLQGEREEGVDESRVEKDAKVSISCLCLLYYVFSQLKKTNPKQIKEEKPNRRSCGFLTCLEMWASVKGSQMVMVFSLFISMWYNRGVTSFKVNLQVTWYTGLLDRCLAGRVSGIVCCRCEEGWHGWRKVCPNLGQKEHRAPEAG